MKSWQHNTLTAVMEVLLEKQLRKSLASHLRCKICSFFPVLILGGFFSPFYLRKALWKSAKNRRGAAENSSLQPKTLGPEMIGAGLRARRTLDRRAGP
jgi:hypothetical protein